MSGSRREFLAASAIIAASAPSLYATGDDVLKVGLIGCGDRGTNAVLVADVEPKLALGEARKGNVDIVITDLRMGAMSGMELLQALKRKGELLHSLANKCLNKEMAPGQAVRKILSASKLGNIR